MAEAQNALNWFEIPVRDMKRAKKFYETILGIKLQEMEMPGGQYAMWPFAPGVLGGGLIKAKGYVPSKRGTLVYLNGGTDLNKALKKVSKAGGQVIAEKFSIGENGFVATFKDSEGNKIALHSPK